MPNIWNEAPVWAHVDELVRAAPPRPMQAPPLHFFDGLARKKPKAAPAAEVMWDDDLLKLLLSSLDEIFEVPCSVGGPALVERQLGAKKHRAPLFVVMKHPDVRNDFQDYNNFLNKFQELGWGQHVQKPNKDKRYWDKFDFSVRGFNVTLAPMVEDDKFDDYLFGINMIRYSLERGWEQDPRSKKDFDNNTLTCYNKVEPAGLKFIREYVIPEYNELTGKEFTLVKKGK